MQSRTSVAVMFASGAVFVDLETEPGFAAEFEAAMLAEARRREQAIADKLGQPLGWLHSRPRSELEALAAELVFVQEPEQFSRPTRFVVLTRAEYEKAQRAGTLGALLGP